MKFLIFSIFVCFASVIIFSSGHPRKLTGKQILIMKECAQQYNADEKNYANGITFEELEKNPAEAWCMWACGIRKYIAKELTVSDPLKTWYNATTKLIEQASKNGFDQAGAKSTWNFTLQDATNSVENCYSNSKNECDFFKCSDFFFGPIWVVHGYMARHPIENPAFEFIQDE